MADADQFPVGSMGPKVEAAIRFIIHGHGQSIICKPEHLVDAFKGAAGTLIEEDS